MHEMNLQREMFIIQAMLARCVEMELEQFVIQAAYLRDEFARVRGGELYGMAVVLHQKFAGNIRILQGDVASGNVGVDINRGLIFSRSTGGISIVKSVPQDRASIARVGPFVSPSIAFVNTSKC